MNAETGGDAHVTVVGGSCSLWWRNVPPLEGERPGVIGHLSTGDEAGCREVLVAACGRLREEGCTVAIGPMDGTTWHRYRLITDRGEEPPFAMEPDSPGHWLAAFGAEGFRPLATYSSSLIDDLHHRDHRVDRAAVRLEQAGVRIRNLEDFDADLDAIYEISTISFASNFLYTPLAREEFLALYRPARPRLRPEFIFLAEHDGRAVGYMFAFPDFAEAQRGGKARTVVGKTLAILPGRMFAGLGLVLVDRLHQRARELGFSRVIHALQHESNQVRNLTNHFGKVMRRYALMARGLRG